MNILCHYFEYNFLKLALFMKEGILIEILFLRNRDELDMILEAKKSKSTNRLRSPDYSINFEKSKKEFEYIDQQLIDYLEGKLRQFDIPYLLNTSPFITAVLKETSNIPYGIVKTYSEIARKIGNPKAYRAVGNALASNPIPIIIPCHRVIKSNGEIGGFGGTPELKRKLLIHEGYRQYV